MVPGPHRPAPLDALAATGADVVRLRLPRTFRLGPVTTALVAPAFYPDLPFTSARPPAAVVVDDEVQPEVATVTVRAFAGSGDPALADAAARRARALLSNGFVVDADGTRALRPADVAVVAAHVAQAAAVRARLADLPEVLVTTINAAQGVERPAVVLWHPLAGQRAVPEFDVHPGRLCVGLSRHRCHLSVVLDAAQEAALGAAERSGAVGGRALAAQRRALDALLAAPSAAA